MNNKKFKRKIAVYIVVFICLAIVVETAILNFSNKKQVNRTSQILLAQVERILNINK